MDTGFKSWTPAAGSPSTWACLRGIRCTEFRFPCPHSIGPSSSPCWRPWLDGVNLDDAAESAYRAGIASGDAHSAHNLAVMLRDNGELARAAEFHELAKQMGDPTPLQAPSD